MVSVRNNSTVPDDTIDLHAYLALLHDRMVPKFLRKLIDSIIVGVPEALLIKTGENPKYQLAQLDSQLDYKRFNNLASRKVN